MIAEQKIEIIKKIIYSNKPFLNALIVSTDNYYECKSNMLENLLKTIEGLLTK